MDLLAFAEMYFQNGLKIDHGKVMSKNGGQKVYLTRQIGSGKVWGAMLYKHSELLRLRPRAEPLLIRIRWVKRLRRA